MYLLHCDSWATTSTEGITPPSKKENSITMFMVMENTCSLLLQRKASLLYSRRICWVCHYKVHSNMSVTKVRNSVFISFYVIKDYIFCDRYVTFQGHTQSLRTRLCGEINLIHHVFDNYLFGTRSEKPDFREALYFSCGRCHSVPQTTTYSLASSPTIAKWHYFLNNNVNIPQLPKSFSCASCPYT